MHYIRVFPSFFRGRSLNRVLKLDFTANGIMESHSLFSHFIILYGSLQNADAIIEKHIYRLRRIYSILSILRVGMLM